MLVCVAGKGGVVDADNDEEGIGIMKQMGENMANVLKKTSCIEGTPGCFNFFCLTMEENSVCTCNNMLSFNI